ncbi:MAG TPA: S9 family peptidase [Thermoanaerobaculia bacterium]|nr:S9 family peptidase [Thermoanaerobaculia bacterium]
MRVLRTGGSAALLLLALSAPAGAEKHPFDVHDLLAMERISDPQASPDGSLVAFTLRRTDLDANRGRTDLWMVSADGSGLRRLTTHEASDSHARWAPDGGSVLFLSTRSGSSQVWRLRLDGGEAVQETDLPLDVSGFAVAPDGEGLIVSLEVFPDCPTLVCTVSRLEAVESAPASGRVFDRLPIRHWDTWRDGRRFHLFRVAPGADPVDLMAGMDADCPSRPFGGAEEYTVTPDGKSVVFTAKDAGREEAWSTNFDLWLAPVDGSAAPRRLTESPAWDTRPVFSPDGRTLAYLAMERAGFEADRLRIVLRYGLSGPERVLVPDWDRSANEIVWSRDGRTIYTTAQDLGHASLFAIEVESGRVSKLVGEGTNASPMLLAGDRIGYAKDDLSMPVELYSIGAGGRGGESRLTRINDERLAEIAMGEAEQFTFAGARDETVHAWVVKPAGFDPAKTYPVAFLVHGGPQGSFSNHFHYRWNPQVYAGRGYAAVMVDFHGSTGYGQAFTDAIRGDWGGKPLEDLRKGLDAALARSPWMDGDRVCALGASYGGYMINWIAGNWPDRFRCLVSHDGNLDERFAYYATEELWFPEWEHGGTPWENPEGYAKHNPALHVDRWRTPMLVVHGALDFRVVETEGFATFTALQRKGIPSKLLWFPDENHWVLKPQNSIQWHDTVLDWLDQWLKPAPDPTPATEAAAEAPAN